MAETLLLTGDWHGNTGWSRAMVDRAKRGGHARLFQVGDFGYWEHEESGVQFLDQLATYAGKAGVTVYFLDGNHDKTSLLLEKYTERDDDGFLLVRPNVRYAPRGHRWSWGAVRFAAFGGAYSVDKDYRLDLESVKHTSETLWFPEEEMSDADMDGFLADSTPVDVILCHDKPRSSSPRWNRKDVPDCFPNQERIQRAAVALEAKLLVHGHLHYRYTDLITTGDGRQCRVEGLDADPDAAMGVAKKDSWMVLPLDAAPVAAPSRDTA